MKLAINGPNRDLKVELCQEQVIKIQLLFATELKCQLKRLASFNLNLPHFPAVYSIRGDESRIITTSCKFLRTSTESLNPAADSQEGGNACMIDTCNARETDMMKRT